MLLIVIACTMTSFPSSLANATGWVGREGAGRRRSGFSASGSANGAGQLDGNVVRIRGPCGGGSVSDYIFKLVFIWITLTSAIVSLKHGKWPPSLGAILKVAFLTFFIVVTMAYGMQHGFNGLELGFFSPTLAGFLGVTPLLLFSFLGFESVNSAAGEMKNPAKDVPSRLPARP